MVFNPTLANRVADRQLFLEALKGLKKYGEHWHSCGLRSGEPACTCGLAALLAKIEEATK